MGIKLSDALEHLLYMMELDDGNGLIRTENAVDDSGITNVCSECIGCSVDRNSPNFKADVCIFYSHTNDPRKQIKAWITQAKMWEIVDG